MTTIFERIPTLYNGMHLSSTTMTLLEVLLVHIHQFVII